MVTQHLGTKKSDEKVNYVKNRLWKRLKVFLQQRYLHRAHIYTAKLSIHFQ